jgi:hypothetical protein
MKLIAILFTIAILVLAGLSEGLGQQASTSSSVLIPHLIRFSGVVKNSSGRPTTGINGITFGLYREQEGGAPLWVETQNVSLDGQGRYEVLLGSQHSEGVPLDLFSSGEAQWLGIHVQGQIAEQPRVLMVSVPYALKAADSDTVGGLPPSAFVLATPPSSASAPATVQPVPSVSSSQTSPSVAGSGTANFVPLWTPDGNTLGNSVMFQSGTGSGGKIGLNTTSPATTLDVKGAATVRGALVLPPTGTATSSTGRNSQPAKIAASSYSSTTNSALNQVFQWQAEPSGNNTGNPGGTLNLLFGSGSNAAVETGLRIGSNGQIAFANGQIFPGTGSVTSVGLSAPASDFSVGGSPVTSNGTLGLNWTVAPTSANAANAIVKRDGSGNFNANTITASTFSGANAAFTGGVNAGGIVGGSVTGLNPGAFTDAEQDDYVSAQIGGANIHNEYSYAQPGYATEALASAIVVPNTATKHQASAISGYAESQVNGNSGLGPNVVGGYFQARAATNGAAVWGINPLLTDTTGVSGHWMLNEYDIALYGNPSFLTFEIDTGSPWTGTVPSGVPFGFNCTTGAAWKILCLNPTGHTLPIGIAISRGSVTGSGIQLDGQCVSGACPSQAISMAGYDSSNAGHAMTIQTGFGVPSGNCNVGSIYSNTNPTSASTVLYVYYPTNKWNAVSVP